MTNEDVLNSWKEVASYLGRGVRTVQRWEQELRLPVRRPRGKSRSAVIAFKTELDVWLHQSRDNSPLVTPQVPSLLDPTPLTVARSTRSQLHEKTTALAERMGQLLVRSNGLCERSKLLSEQVNRMLALAAKSRETSGRKNGSQESMHK